MQIVSRVHNASTTHGRTALMLLAIVGGMGGCQTAHQKPPTRLGSLPFPGVTSLFAAAEPERLAPHYYRPRYMRLLEAEGDRGIVYTKQAGFVDISHAREAMDWTRYVAVQLANAPLSEDRRTVAFSFENVQVTVTTAAALSDDERIDVAAGVVYRLLVWHEVSTWLGYSMVPFVSERRSAFTPDDLTAHAIGVRVAKEVLREGPDLATYEQRTGEALERAIAQLEPMAADGLGAFCETLEGVWWSGVECLVTDINMGLRTGVKQPLIADEASRQPTAGAGIVWDALRSGLTYELQVRGSVAADVRAQLGTATISSDAQLEQLVRAVGDALAAKRTFAWSDDLAEDGLAEAAANRATQLAGHR